jgi:hypothetical protein
MALGFTYRPAVWIILLLSCSALPTDGFILCFSIPFVKYFCQRLVVQHMPGTFIQLELRFFQSAFVDLAEVRTFQPVICWQLLLLSGFLSYVIFRLCINELSYISIIKYKFVLYFRHKAFHYKLCF